MTRKARLLLPVAGALLGAGAFLLRSRARRSIAGRVALITGGSRGLGLELARELAAQGCRLILVARDADQLARAAT